MTTIIDATSGPAIIIDYGGDNAESARQAAIATAAADSATLAANSVAAAARYFSTQAAGEAGSTTGQFFSHKDGAGGIVFRERTTSGSDIIGSAATSADIDAVAADLAVQTARVDRADAALAAATPQRPAYVEQRLAGFFGRGKLDAEANATVTDQEISNAPLAIGATGIDVADKTKFDAGAPVVIDYDDGTKGNHFVAQIGSTMTIRPPLPKAVASGGRVERVWWDYAHPGKGYMRWLAQRIAAGTEYEFAMPMGAATIHSDMTDNDLTAVGSTITWLAGSNVAHSAAIADPINKPGRVAYVDGVSNGEGVETALFPVAQPGQQLCRVRFYGHVTTVSYVIEVRDQDGLLLGSYAIPPAAHNLPRDYTFPFNSRAASELRVRVLAESGATGVANEFFTVSSVDVFPAPATNGLAIAKRDAKIVAFGDSWIAGTPERLGLAAALAETLPDADVLNEGAGGETLPNLLARWDADVVAHAPDYVVVCVGTNDSYSPSSATFDPNARNNMKGYYRDLLARADKAGIRLILIGPPALTQNDPAQPALAEWELNDRAGAYARDLEADAAVVLETAAVGTPVAIAFDFTASPGASQVLLRRMITAPTTLADDFAGSYGIVGTNPAAAWTANVNKNGGTVGTIAVSTAGVVTFATSGTGVSLVAGDRLDVIAPATADANITNAGFAFAGTQQ